MNKFTTIILVGIAFIICIGFAGATGYYVGNKMSSNQESTKQSILSPDDVPESVKNQIKDDLRNELEAEIRADVIKQYTEMLNQSQTENKIEESTNSDANKTDKKAEEKQSNVRTSYNNKPFIKVHDVTVSNSAGDAALEQAINSALDDCSSTAVADANDIDGIGTFQITWTSTDGATATSNITVTE